MSGKEVRPFLEALGERVPGDRLDPWMEATEAMLPVGDLASRARLLKVVAAAWAWRELGRELAGSPRDLWRQRIAEAGLVRHLGPEAVRALLEEAPGGTEAALALAGDEARLERLLGLGAGPLRDRLLEDTGDARVLLETLRESPPTPVTARVAALTPELTALGVEHDPMASLEHERSESGRVVHPLLDHLTLRVLGRKLAGLEAESPGIFQHDESLGEAGFHELAARLEGVRSAGLLPILRAALLHLDFAKGGSRAQREAWSRDLEADLHVHNQAARVILERARAPGRPETGALKGFTLLRDHPAFERLVLALVQVHGLAGQRARGETPLAAFAPWISFLRRDAATLAASMRLDPLSAREVVLDVFHLMNVCDTAGVREGLLDDALLEKLEATRDEIGEWVERGGATDEARVTAEMLGAEEDRLRRLDGAARRAAILGRLVRLREARLRAGEPRESLAEVVAALPEEAVEHLSERLRRAQFWYAEAGSAGLSPEGQLKLLALGMGSAAAAAGEGLYHVSLQPLLEDFLAVGDPATPYRLRLIETLLAPAPLEGLLSEGRAALGEGGQGLGTFTGTWGGASSVALDFKASPEAEALLTLLPIYETKSSAAFHATLKSLCDLYGLRKDEFDRVANEAMYLVHMNSARSDKARMLDFVRPGRIVEVGPGGGVVLDLLEERFPDSEVIGIDVSAMVVEALERRRSEQGRRWTILEGDAFELPEHFGEESVDTVVFCSVLHEIYSYVEYPDAGGVPGRYRLESVRDLVRAAYRTLKPGGRLVVRDGVEPPEGRRLLRFLAPGAREFFQLFAEQFAGREIRFEQREDGRVALSAADAFEFLYTYNWGPESFPYEVREQYGVLRYDEYRRSVLEWLADEPAPARAVELPPGLDSYLQEGYRIGLAEKIELSGEDGGPVELPDSNALWVYEKPA